MTLTRRSCGELPTRSREAQAGGIQAQPGAALTRRGSIGVVLSVGERSGDVNALPEGGRMLRFGDNLDGPFNC